MGKAMEGIGLKSGDGENQVKLFHSPCNDIHAFVQERERTNAMLKEEMARLVHKLTKEEQGANNQKIKTSNFSA
jgi:hypothetical protein